MTTSQERWLAAVHEAGHAVAAVRLNFDLKNVSITNAYCCCARLEPTEQPISGMRALTAQEEHRDALYTLAGGKAELELPWLSEERLSASDRDYFRTLGPKRASPAELEEWRCSCELAAQELVRRHWKAILAVANALRDKDALSHREVRRIVETT